MINRQFFCFKFNSGFLKEKKYNVTMTFEEAIKKDKLIALADSQALRLIRKETNHEVDLDLINQWYEERDKLRKKKNSKENRERIAELQKNIYDVMYISEYITIVMEDNSHYRHLFKNGLMLNGKKYIRTFCSASQGRVSTVVFVEEEVSRRVLKRLDNGRNLEKQLVASKFNAYAGLATSATKVVSTPKVCVVKDCVVTRDVKVNWVTEVENDFDDDIVEEKEVPLEFNLFDGNGLISPKFAQKWVSELDLDYLPAQFCIRANYIKGMLSVFDFHDFCHEINNDIYETTDIYGKKVDLREIDVILTESQFKLWDSFVDYQTYEKNCIENGLTWGISLYTPKKDKDILELNYQYIQTLKLTDDDIRELCEQTVEYFRSVSYQDVVSSILFCMGTEIQEQTIPNFLMSSDKYWLKSLIINHDMINDKYIKQKIHDDLTMKLRNSCLGRIYVDGNYSVLVPDSFAFMEYVCGMKVNGLLNEHEIYSKYWTNKNVRIVDTMRSPLTHVSEHNILNVVKNEKIEKWFKYYYTGTIVNCHGIDVLRWAGSDWDYDLIATTSNKTIINGVWENQFPIVYQPPKSEKTNITSEKLFNADLFTFGSIIGRITNDITVCYVLLPLFEKDSIEYNILMNRMKMGCKLQSQQIDRAKIGREVKGIPKGWKKYQEPIDKETEINNSLLCDKHPYFFTYLYQGDRLQYKKHFGEYDLACKLKFGKSLNEILGLTENELSKEQKETLDKFKKFSPVYDYPCEMNRLCHYMESVTKDIKLKVGKDDIDKYFSLMQDNNIIKDDQIYLLVKSELKKYYSEIKTYLKFHKSTLPQYKRLDKTYDEDKKTYLDNVFRRMKSSFDIISPNRYEITNCLVEIFYKDLVSYSKNILWENYGKYICENIKNNSDSNFVIPVKEDNGDIEYLNQRYKEMRVDIFESTEIDVTE